MATTPGSLRLKLPFPGCESLERNFSQAGQDLFVLSMLDGKREGTFLDLGCHHPIVINNTFLLESEFAWNGLSVDIEPGFFELFVFRRSKTLVGDCTKLDWDVVTNMLGTANIDYLSLDLEPPNVTLECLRSIPFDRVSFSVVTFEHDSYRSGHEVRNESREIFESNGYRRVCADIRLDGLQFEDWYVNPKLVDTNRASTLAVEDESWQKAVFE